MELVVQWLDVDTLGIDFSREDETARIRVCCMKLSAVFIEVGRWSLGLGEKLRLSIRRRGGLQDSIREGKSSKCVSS